MKDETNETQMGEREALEDFVVGLESAVRPPPHEGNRDRHELNQDEERSDLHAVPP